MERVCYRRVKPCRHPAAYPKEQPGHWQSSPLRHLRGRTERVCGEITFSTATRQASILFAISLCLGLYGWSPSFARQADGNWMREFVQLRVLERSLRAVGAQTGRLSDTELRSLIPSRIYGGTWAGAADNPFQVALLWRNKADNFDAQYCGGTLVRENFVVTAAHCSDFVTANQVQVLTGTRMLDGTGVRRNVSRIVIHPDWDTKTGNNDVAVWKLSSNAPGIALATLATEDGPVGGNLLATGWGETELGQAEIRLRRVEVPLVTQENCNDANSYVGKITDRMLCAGPEEGRRGVCFGDSGGPLTRGIDNSVLTGITSWGSPAGCAKPNLFGVYTRVSNPAIRNFIEDSLYEPPTENGPVILAPVLISLLI
jgi:trypsin